jgi:hypothetical protein
MRRFIIGQASSCMRVDSASLSGPPPPVILVIVYLYRHISFFSSQALNIPICPIPIRPIPICPIPIRPSTAIESRTSTTPSSLPLDSPLRLTVSPLNPPLLTPISGDLWHRLWFFLLLMHCRCTTQTRKHHLIVRRQIVHDAQFFGFEESRHQFPAERYQEYDKDGETCGRRDQRKGF